MAGRNDWREAMVQLEQQRADPALDVCAVLPSYRATIRSLGRAGQWRRAHVHAHILVVHDGHAWFTAWFTVLSCVQLKGYRAGGRDSLFAVVSCAVCDLNSRRCTGKVARHQSTRNPIRIPN